MLGDRFHQSIQKLLLKHFLTLSQLDVLVPAPEDLEGARVLDFELECEGLTGVNRRLGWEIAMALLGA